MRSRVILRWLLSFGLLSLYTALLVVSQSLRDDSPDRLRAAVPSVQAQEMSLPAVRVVKLKVPSVREILLRVIADHPFLLPILFPHIS